MIMNIYIADPSCKNCAGKCEHSCTILTSITQFNTVQIAMNSVREKVAEENVCVRHCDMLFVRMFPQNMAAAIQVVKSQV